MPNFVTLTPQEILVVGLELMGWAPRRVAKSKPLTNTRRFRSHYGCKPRVLAQIFEDLQTTTIAAAQIDSSKISIKDFLAAVHFLKRYPTEIDLSDTPQLINED